GFRAALAVAALAAVLQERHGLGPVVAELGQPETERGAALRVTLLTGHLEELARSARIDVPERARQITTGGAVSLAAGQLVEVVAAGVVELGGEAVAGVELVLAAALGAARGAHGAAR